jgi:putative transposase
MVKAREGDKAAHERLGLVRPGLRPLAPLDIVQIDHTQVDVHLVDDLGRAPLGRPYLTLLLDVHSRCVLGFVVSFDTPSAAVVALAIAQGVLPKGKWLDEHDLQIEWPVHGIPKLLHLDNAPEFHSRALKRGCEQHGIVIDYRPRGKPHFGGHIERLMGTLMTRIHALPGSTSSNVVERGDYPSEEKAVLTLSEFELVFAREVLGIYHNELHSDLSKTPLAAWAEGVAKVDKARLPLNNLEALVLDFLPFEERIVGREGVRLFNTNYFHGGLGSLLAGPNRKRRVKYDPRDVSAVFVEMPDGGHLRVPYADLNKPPISLWEHRAARQTLREQGRGTINEDAIFAAIKANREAIALAQANSKTARRARARSPIGRAEVSVPARFAPEHQSLDMAVDAPRHVLDENAKVPQVVEYQGWKTEFSS